MATETADDANRRKSGRVTRKPGLLAEEQADTSQPPTSSTKRKRTKPVDGSQDGDDDLLSGEESEDESETGEPDEEELREHRKQSKKNTASVKPAAKRTKLTNGASTTLAIRSANIQGKPASKSVKVQKARSRPSQGQQQGLYAEVFGRGQDAEDTAANWHQRVQRDSVASIRDLVNFILQCVGCEVRIESQDIEDVDNIPHKLGDVIDEYAEKETGEYPLTSRLKQFVGFREVLTEFFKAVIKVMHTSGTLYEQKDVYENIHVWVATMSGAGYRPFRHTAAVVSLAMCTALCEITKEIQSAMSTARTQIDAETKKKKGVNKGRVAAIQESLKEEETKLETVDAFLNDAFDTVFVHRYRDVDEKIRVDCAAALGNWMMLYRKKFLEGQYLRYLGWVLSDTYAPTRSEVLKQLRLLFSNQKNVSALRAFNDRFRPRIVEMGTRDADTSVRAEALDLLDKLRNLELLDAEDVDTVGRLIFDSEPRIRKATAKFFVSNVEDLYQVIVEGLDQEQLISVLPEELHDTDFLKPTRTWLKFKCLAQTMHDYDKESDSANDVNSVRPVLIAEETDSRATLATQAIFSHMPELQHWECLAGLLLHDHSSSGSRKRKSDAAGGIHSAFKLESGEELILLDVLHNAVKLYLLAITDSQSDKKSKKSQSSKADISRKQEKAAHQLTVIIPQLLNKFGSIPQAVALILRLEPLLNVDLINDIHGGEGSYSDLLEDVNKQFVSHSDRKVLAEASRAFQTARSYDQSRPIADQKVEAIWSESASRLHTLFQNQNIETRGTLDRAVLTEICNIMSRLASVASVSDCTTAMEAKLAGLSNKKTKNRSSNTETLLELLMQVVKRGVPDADSTDDFAELEDQLCFSVITVVSFYFRWKVVSLRTAVLNQQRDQLGSDSLANLALHRSVYVENTVPIIQQRLPLDPVRISTMLNLLDLFILFSTIKNMRPDDGDLDEDITTNLKSLTINLPDNLVAEVLSTHDKLEKSLAKKTKRKLAVIDTKKFKSRTVAAPPVDEDENIDRPPEDSDDEAEDSDAADSDDDADDGEEQLEDGTETASAARNARKQAALMVEQSLCELASKMVLGIIAGVLDTTVKARLHVNKTKLGKNYSQVIAYLDEKKSKKKPATSKPSSPQTKRKTAPPAAATGTGSTPAKKKGVSASASVPSSAAKASAQPTRKSNRVRLSTAIIENSDSEDDEDDDEDEDEGDEDVEEDEIENQIQSQGKIDEESDQDNDEDEVMGD